MGGDDYIITKNSKYSDPAKAAHDLDEQVTQLQEQIKVLRTAIERHVSNEFDNTWPGLFEALEKTK